MKTDRGTDGSFYSSSYRPRQQETELSAPLIFALESPVTFFYYLPLGKFNDACLALCLNSVLNVKCESASSKGSKPRGGPCRSLVRDCENLGMQL